MNTQKRKFNIWLGTLGLVCLLGLLSLGNNPPKPLIHANPRDFLLQENDLPVEGRYTIPQHELHPIPNELIVYLLGDISGVTRIVRTGRVNGWRVHYVRSDVSAALPEEITQTVTQYESARGARLNLANYTMSGLYPESGWRRMETDTVVGDDSLVEYRSEEMPYGRKRISYAISFIYLNMEVRLETIGEDGQIRLEDAFGLAQIVLARLGKIETHTHPVPTPTPGFETVADDRPIYR